MGYFAGSSATVLRVMLAGALVLNFNAYLILFREIMEREVPLPELDGVVQIAASGFVAAGVNPDAKAVRECLERSVIRGLREHFNAAEWDQALDALASS
jgi:hypothetical protein